jgi:hypothetical protein
MCTGAGGRRGGLCDSKCRKRIKGSRWSIPPRTRGAAGQLSNLVSSDGRRTRPIDRPFFFSSSPVPFFPPSHPCSSNVTKSKQQACDEPYCCPLISPPTSPIDYKSGYGRFPVSTSCVTSANPDSLSSSETGVNLGIRS